MEAIVDIDLGIAKKKAKKYSIKKIFTDFKQMLSECPNIQVVSVCTPNKFHAEMSIACLRAGKEVFCEKPPALNAEETLRMKKVAEENNRILMFNFNNRARTEAKILKKYIDSGEIGRINSCQAVWIRRIGIPGFGGWFTQKALAGGGCTIDLIHNLDLALYFMGYPKPEWVAAQTYSTFSDDRRFKGPWGRLDVPDGIVDVETASHAFIMLKTGQVIFVRTSWAEMNKIGESFVTFQGTKGGGMLRRRFEREGIAETAIDECEVYTMENDFPVNKKVIFDTDKKMGREKGVINFVNTVLGKAKPLNNTKEAIKIMKIIDAIYKSDLEKRPVRIK